MLEHFDRFEDVLEMTSCKRGDARLLFVRCPLMGND